MNIRNTRKTLIQKIKEQYNEPSWTYFVDNYKPYILKVLLNIGVSKSDCEDLTQDVLLAVWKQIPRFEYKSERSSFRSWLLTITKNKAMTYFNAMNSRQKRDFDNFKNSLNSVIPDIYKIAEEQWMLFISRKAIENIKQDFSKKVFSVFEKFNAGNNVVEIAKDAEIDDNTVYTYNVRVKKAIKKEIIRLELHLS